jgi:hypothetical protein
VPVLLLCLGVLWRGGVLPDWLVLLVGLVLATPVLVFLLVTLALLNGDGDDADGAWGRAKHLSGVEPPYPMRPFGFRWPGERRRR